MLSTFAPYLLIAAAAGGVAYALLYPLLSGEKRAQDRRMALAPIARQAEAQARTSRGGEVRTKRDQVAQSLKEVEAREKARGKPSLEDKLAQAGLSIDKRAFYIASAISGLVLAMIAMIAMKSPIGLLPGLIVGGLGLPNWYLGIFEPLCHLRQGRPIVGDNDVRPLGGKMLDRAPHEDRKSVV